MGKNAWNWTLEAMGAKRGRRGGDIIVGSRQLIGIFFLLVVALGFVFTLGYLLARSQYDPRLRVAASPISAAPAPTHAGNANNVPKPGAKQTLSPNAAAAATRAKPIPPARSDWDFYHSGEPEKTPENLPGPPGEAGSRGSKISPGGAARLEAPAAAKPVARAGSPSVASKAPPSKPTVSPLIPRGATVLQIAATVREADALALAQALQQKKFPAFVVTPDADHYYRVQVGPYPNAQAANAARQKLEKQGFKSIVKR